MTIGNHTALERDELHPDGVIERVLPVDAGENVRRKFDSHRRHFERSLGFLNELVLCANMLQQGIF